MTTRPQLGVQPLTIFAFFQFQITAWIVIRARFLFFFFPPSKNVFHFVPVHRREYRVAVKFSDGPMLLRVIQGVMFRGFCYCLLKHAPVVVTGNATRRDLRDINHPSATISFPITSVKLFKSAGISPKSFSLPESQRSPSDINIKTNK